MNRPTKKPTPVAPSFEMSDEPFVDPRIDQAENAVFTAEDLGNPLSDVPKTRPAPPARAGQPATPTIDNAPDHVRYESRIQILEAFRYMGSFVNAPPWIDRNWLSHGDHDPLRNIEAGPALRIPLDSGVVIARLGDYVCQQSVALTEGVSDIRLEVWPAETFQKLFIPKSSRPQTIEPEAPAIVSA